MSIADLRREILFEEAIEKASALPGWTPVPSTVPFVPMIGLVNEVDGEWVCNMDIDDLPYVLLRTSTIFQQYYSLKSQIPYKVTVQQDPPDPVGG